MFEWLFKYLWSQKRGKTPDPTLEAVSYTVHQGKRYRATVTLSWGEQMVATNDYIGNMLVGYGFKNVSVKGDGARRTAEGVWGKPDTTAPLETHLSNVVEVA